MKIHHLAIWVDDLEKMKAFYMRYFNMQCSKIYRNKTRNFSSYFLSFPKGAQLEIMHQPNTRPSQNERGNIHGLAHFSISLGSRELVDQLTNRLRADGIKVIGEPRTTGDGYYESVILDPEENQLELTV